MGAKSVLKSSQTARRTLGYAAMKVTATLVAAAMLTSYRPTASAPPVHQAQTHYFVSDEDKYLNDVMVRAYTTGDMESLKELLQYWQDEHSPAL